MHDADVPAWWQRLGLPGLIDVHVHFMPERVMAAVWDYFDHADVNYGRAWPVQYRGTDAERVAKLAELGVRRYSALLYPHKPDMAESLSAWARSFAASNPACVATGTFFPEESAAGYVRAALDAATVIFKAHVQVGGYDPRDPLLDPVWGLLAEAGVPVIVHCGSGPIPGVHTGPGPISEVLRRHPSLTAVIAHAGAPEYDEHLDLAETYPNVHLDTTMVGTTFMNEIAAVPRSVIGRFGQLQDRIVLGADFPNIPYQYAEQLDALDRFELGDDWLRAVCWDNGARLIGAPAD
ncbi:amidohydrolase family protein [uncultured Jatrophihabitans sp.]|uniref:amidohydrolase family protein n=1 Tax=uncultured Jatrophihabitans sp. TaxID=1610747 RepID=UPI0035CA7F1B